MSAGRGRVGLGWMAAMFVVLVACLAPEGAEATFACARENHAKQVRQFPDWEYTMPSRTIPNKASTGFARFWEPILEEVPGCTGLGSDRVMEFKFLVVLDESWVTMYGKHKDDFAREGYDTLEESPNFVVGPASYLFEKQFGVRLSISRVFAIPDLAEKCATNNMIVEDHVEDEMNTLYQLKRQHNAEPRDSEALVVRLGVGSKTPGQYCHSYAGTQICNKNGLVVNQRPVFRDDGRVNSGAALTFAHEIAHTLKLCGASKDYCKDGHLINSIPDIMVADGRPATQARSIGMFSKFLTTCTVAYEELLCPKVRASSCGVSVPRIATVPVVPVNPGGNGGGSCSNKNWQGNNGKWCNWFSENNRCSSMGDTLGTNGWTAKTACCACGGGNKNKRPGGGGNGGGNGRESCSNKNWQGSNGKWCKWFSQNRRCLTDGFTTGTNGWTAKTACCACGGGNKNKRPCTDEPGWKDRYGDGCSYYHGNDMTCLRWGSFVGQLQKSANQACCICGGGQRNS